MVGLPHHGREWRNGPGQHHIRQARQSCRLSGSVPPWHSRLSMSGQRTVLLPRLTHLMRVSGNRREEACQNQRLHLRMSATRARTCDASAAPDAVDDDPLCRHVHELRLGAQRGRRCAAAGAGFGGRAAGPFPLRRRYSLCWLNLVRGLPCAEAVTVCPSVRSRGGADRLGVVGWRACQRLEGARRSSGKQRPICRYRVTHP